MDRLKGVGKKSDQCVPQMRLQRKTTYGEFPEFVREKKFTYTVHILKKLILKSEFIFVI